jgi:hypothetical protein
MEKRKWGVQGNDYMMGEGRKQGRIKIVQGKGYAITIENKV